jgi:hypothetical protein
MYFFINQILANFILEMMMLIGRILQKAFTIFYRKGTKLAEDVRGSMLLRAGKVVLFL